MKSAAMESLLYGISQVLERMRPYLLDGQALIFAPEYVFSDMNTGKIWLCYMPGNEGGEERGQEGFRRLAEFLLKSWTMETGGRWTWGMNCLPGFQRIISAWGKC